jgi:predicted HNH restriction endonuclease
MHRRAYFKKHYQRSQLQEGVMLCKLCHKAIHIFYDEMTLAKHLNTLLLLQQDNRVQIHVAWVKKQKAS